MVTYLNTRSLASSSDIREGAYPADIPQLALCVLSLTPSRFPVILFLCYLPITSCLSNFRICARFISDLRLVVRPPRLWPDGPDRLLFLVHV